MDRKEKNNWKRKKQLEDGINALDRFPGSLAEYNELKRHEYEIMDTGTQEKYMFIDQEIEWDLLKKLLDERCVGFIRYIPLSGSGVYSDNSGGYGIPVKRK